MKARSCTTTMVALLATLSVFAAAPIPSHADASNRQNSKNTWRNIGIGSAAIGALGLANHNGTQALLGAAGAAYSANRYEQDRRSQARAERESQRHYNRTHNTGYRHSRKYYWYNGHEYYESLATGHRYRVG